MKMRSMIGMTTLFAALASAPALASPSALECEVEVNGSAVVTAKTSTPSGPAGATYFKASKSAQVFGHDVEVMGITMGTSLQMTLSVDEAIYGATTSASSGYVQVSMIDEARFPYAINANCVLK